MKKNKIWKDGSMKGRKSFVKSSGFALSLVAAAVLSGLSANVIAQDSVIVDGSEVVSYQDPQTSIATVFESSVGADVKALEIFKRGTVQFVGTEAAVSTVSASNTYPTYEGGDWPQVTAGVSIFGIGTLTSDQASSLVISAENTGKGYVPVYGDNSGQNIDKANFAGFVVGLQAEGGKIDLQGKTIVSAKGDGAYAVGMALQALPGDSEWVTEQYENLKAEDFTLTADFGGDLTVTATSKQSGAEAVRLGGYVPGEGDADGGYTYPEDVTVVMNTSATGTTTITASTNSENHESVGVNFVYPDAEGSNPIDTPEEFTTARGYLNLNGTTVITADHALKGDVGYVTNKGDLTLNGRVDQFKGEFTQESGSTTLNDATGGFFGGSVAITGGTLTAANAKWDSLTNGNLKVSDAELSLHTLAVNSNGKLELSNSTVTANFFNVANREISIDAGGSSFVLNGNDDEDSAIHGTVTGIKDLIVNGGTLDLTEGAELAFVEGGRLIFNDGALFSVRGKMGGADVIFNDGTYVYEPEPNVANELRIESGNVTFNGQVGLLTGVTEDGSDMDFDKVDYMTALSIGPNDSTDEPDPNVTFNGGTYDFERVQAQAGLLTLTGEKGNVSIDSLEVTGGTVVASGGMLTADKISFDEETTGKLKLDGATLTTYTDQIFIAGLGEDGTEKNPEGLKNEGRIDFIKGTVAFNDDLYNDYYKSNAAILTGNGVTVVFNGQNVNLPEGELNLDDVIDNPDVVESNANVAVSGDDATDGHVTLDKSFGVSTITAGEGVSAFEITDSKQITLVGGKNEDGSLKELISFVSDQNEGVKISSGKLVLGQNGSVNNEGQLSAAVSVEQDGTFAVSSGDYRIESVTSSGQVDVTGGKASFGTIVAQGGSIAVAQDGVASVEKLTAEGEVTLTGALTAEAIASADQTQATINIGTAGDEGSAGSLTLGGQTLAGVTYFLDPAYKDGIEQGSSLKFEGTTIDGKIIAGQNSYVVLGSKDDSALLKLFGENGNLSWGGDTGQIGSAVFVAKPITVTAVGGIYADASLTQSVPVSDGSVYFAANSALVADVTGVEEGTSIITVEENASVTVVEGSKAVLVGDIKQSIGYQLINNDEANKAWGQNLIAGNGMWNLTMNDEGKIEATLNDASLVYGNAMQGTALANAGMLASGAEYDYVNALLTDASGNISALPSVAERFDAAMNPAGALTTFTTAYDRASDLRRIVREESLKGQGNRLWAQVSGSMTNLDGISSGGRAINTETNAYGLAVGAEVEFSDIMLGAAFTGGTGHTDNDAVSGKDDFNYYGLSFYGKTSLGGFNLLGDVSATWLKSDLTIGGVADVDTDTTTTVYSLGVQGEKTFAMSWADVTPFIGVDVYHVRSDGFGNGHGAEIDDSDATAVEIPIGARLSKNIETTGGFHVAPSFMLAVVPTVADTEIDSKVTFAGADSTYNFTFADDVKVRTNIGLDAVKDNFSFGLRAGYEWGNEERSSMNMQLRAKYAF